jgi:hypothetical protein
MIHNLHLNNKKVNPAAAAEPEALLSRRLARREQRGIISNGVNGKLFFKRRKEGNG